MAEQQLCVECGETIPEERAKRVACVTCSKPCQQVHRRATTSRSARLKRKRAKQPRSVLLKVGWFVASTFKRAAQAAGLSQAGWACLIVETLLEDDPTARGWALQRCWADSEPVGPGAEVIHMRFPVPLLARMKERVAQDGQQRIPWLRRACYTASLFAKDWHPTGTVERLKLGHEFLVAHDLLDEARELKETAFKRREGTLDKLTSQIQQARAQRGLLHWDTEEEQTEQERFIAWFGELKRIRDGACEWEELNTAFEPYSLLDEDKPSQADEDEYLEDILADHRVDVCPLSQIIAARAAHAEAKRQWEYRGDYGGLVEEGSYW